MLKERKKEYREGKKNERKLMKRDWIQILKKKIRERNGKKMIEK